MAGATLASARGSGQSPALDGRVPLIDRPWTHDEEKFSFVILGDKTSGGEGKWPIYDRAVDAMNLLDPDFVMSIGDMIPGHMTERAQWDAEWSEYMEHARRLNAPLFFTVGNHDIANVECYRYWSEDFGKTYYAFDYKGCHFVVLNTEEERIDGRGPVWQAMMQWMREDLSRAGDARHTFVFFHKPMWDDPRYWNDWAEVEQALGARPFTVVAGHEHYHSVEKRNGNWHVIQSCTGAGLKLSDEKKWGGFHSFGFVTVDDDAVHYSVVEPWGGIWPVDVSPALFRKAITHELVQCDALPGTDLSADEIRVRNEVVIHNVLDKDVVVRVELPVAEGWTLDPPESEHWGADGKMLRAEVPVKQSERIRVPLGFRVAPERASFPPTVGHSVQYDGHWIEKEAMRMVEVNKVPYFPLNCQKAPEAVQIAGPFRLGPMDTKHLPENPVGACANMNKRFGPEDGYSSEASYEGGMKWRLAEVDGIGLVNANALVGTIDQAACYVYCGVHSDEDQITHATVGADNYSQTFLNGALIELGQDFGGNGGFVYPVLHLKKGWNSLVVKLINNKADWFLRLLIADPRGNLRLSPDPKA